MKHTHVLAAFLLLTCTPLFAAQKKEPQSTLATTNFIQSIGINGEYTTYDIEEQDLIFSGASLQYSRDIYTTKGGTVFTLRLSGSYGTGELEGDTPITYVDEYGNYVGEAIENLAFDATAWGIMVGCDANYNINERCRVFAGPRLGYKSISFDKNEKIDAEMEDLSAYVYGFSVGIRYTFKDSKLGCEAGVNHLWNSWDAEETDTCTSNTIYAGVFYAF